MSRRAADAALPALFATTLFLAAALLFSVQPMIAKAVLPALGGSAAVWTTCSLFFQAALLAGYAGAHALASRLGVRGQAVVHLGLLGASFLTLPIVVAPGVGVGTAPGTGPTVALLAWLVRTAGLPFLAVATTAPLVQRWFATTRHRAARDPYFLYAASNAGSLAALVAYPLWVERHLRLGEQSSAWSTGLALLLAFVAACAGAAALRASREGEPHDDVEPHAGAIPGPAVRGWVALALVPSSLMLGVTTYLTTDLAAVPLLWVVPLALYLVSFILAFSRAREPTGRVAGRVLPLLVMVQAPVMVAGLVQPFWIPLHLATFFSAAVVAHSELARRRPPAPGLTAFYLSAATGGALGGLFNAVVAPLAFNRVVEYPLALAASCLILGFRSELVRENRAWVLPALIGTIAAALCANVGGVAESGFGVLLTILVTGLSVLVAATHRARPVRFALAVGAVLAAGGLWDGVGGRVVDRERNFFGTLRVTQDDTARVRRLFHGSTLHGQQSLDPTRRREPSTYFDRSGPVGAFFASFEARRDRTRARVAVTGLGVGSLASYARPGQRWTFFEIDPAVVRIASDPGFFTFLADSQADALDVIVGDARLALARAPDGSFDLIVLDAFSSDAIPVHLLTREALALYRRKLAGGGTILLNITNRYLDLAPVVALLASDAGLVCRSRLDLRPRAEEEATGVRGSIWAVLASRETDLGPLAVDPLWFTPSAAPGDVVWTDDHASLLGHLRFGRPAAPR
jgi:hypothetical protein